MLEKLIRTIEEDIDFKRNITHWEKIEAREGRYADFPDDVDPLIRKYMTAGEYRNSILTRENALIL